MPTKAPITLKKEITELLASGNFGSEYRQPKFLEWRLTRLDGAGPDTPWYMNWAHTTHQPRPRSPSIVDMLKTRNSWLLPPIVNDAPRTIGRSGLLKADDGGKHTKDEQENPHGNLQSRSGLSPELPLLCCSITLRVGRTRMSIRRCTIC
jgi:hypothetical protein